MLYRVLFGLIPTVVVGLIASGAVSIPGITPVPQYAVVKGGIPGAAITPAEVSQTFREVDASMEAEIRRRAPDEKKRDERLRRERLRQQGKTGWAPEGGGWGR